MSEWKGAVFFDVDGTLVDERKKIYKPTPKVAEAIGQLKKKGYLIGIATGRAKCYIPDTGIDFDCYVNCNGAVAEVQGKEIFNDYFSIEPLKELVNYLRQNNMGYQLECAEACYYNLENAQEFDDMKKLFNLTADCFYPLKDIETVKTSKILITFQRMEQFEALQKKFGDLYLITQHHRNLSADIGKRGVSKASGIQAVIQELGIHIRDTYAFGDDDNDVDMFRAVGCSIAMTPHAKALEAVATRFTGGVEEDGIYHGLKDIGLI